MDWHATPHRRRSFPNQQTGSLYEKIASSLQLSLAIVGRPLLLLFFVGRFQVGELRVCSHFRASFYCALFLTLYCERCHRRGSGYLRVWKMWLILRGTQVYAAYFNGIMWSPRLVCVSWPATPRHYYEDAVEEEEAETCLNIAWVTSFVHTSGNNEGTTSS